MRLLVVSDTHGMIDEICDVIEHEDNIDMLIHLGDYREDAVRLAKMYGLDVVSVRGNCDGAVTREDSETVISVECGDILLTHGHKYDVKWDIDHLVSACLENGYVAAFYGHTHIPEYSEYEGVTILNPGSISLPRGGEGSSYAIVNTDEEGIHGTICYYATRPWKDKDGGNDKKKKASGRWRSLLNYCDRF